MTDVYPVVVGTDGSVRAAAAVTQAAEEAVLRGLPLRLVYGFAPLYGYAGLDPVPPEDILKACEEVLDAEVERIHKALPRVEVASGVRSYPIRRLHWLMNLRRRQYCSWEPVAWEQCVGCYWVRCPRRWLPMPSVRWSWCAAIPVTPNGPIVVGMSQGLAPTRPWGYSINEAQVRSASVRRPRSSPSSMPQPTTTCSPRRP